LYGNVRILVVDNGSSDGSVDFVRNSYPHVEVLALPRNSGYAKANNFGIAYALRRFSPEAVVSLPRKPFIYAWRIHRRLGIPLIARFWSFRALKIVDNLKYGAYGDLLLFFPSLTSNILEAALSNYTIVTDHPMYEVLRFRSEETSQ